MKMIFWHRLLDRVLFGLASKARRDEALLDNIRCIEKELLVGCRLQFAARYYLFQRGV